MHHQAGDQEAFSCTHCQDMTSDRNVCLCVVREFILLLQRHSSGELLHLINFFYGFAIIPIRPNNVVFTKLIAATKSDGARNMSNQTRHTNNMACTGSDGSFVLGMPHDGVHGTARCAYTLQILNQTYDYR